MMNSLWIAKSGMSAQQTQLDVISHNLANVSTTGFKRNRAEFQDLIYQNLRQVGSNTGDETRSPTGLHQGLGVNTASITREFRQGVLQGTTNTFDLAINGNGFFQVQMPDGTIAYTRDGSFKIVGPDGQMTTNDGYPILNGVAKDINAVSAQVQANGTVTFYDKSGNQVGTAGEIQLAVFINPEGLQPIGNNLYRESDSSGAPEVGNMDTGPAFGEIKQGFLEGSNVNVVTELVGMIQAQRAYEMNSKAIQTTDQMLAKLSQL